MRLGSIRAAQQLNGADHIIKTHAKTVVFVTTLLRPREIKMATALRGIGWKVILLYKQTTPFKPEDVFDSAIKFNSDADLHWAARVLQPRLCHVFSGAVDDVVLQFCREKPAKIIIDLNDIFCPSLFNYLQERFEPTRECLSLADGMVCRDLQARYASRFDDFKLPPKMLLFPEYPWIDGPSLPGVVPKGEPDEVRVVSVGTFTLETQGMYDSAYLELARLLTSQRIHLHIYPHWFYRDTSGSVFRFNQEADFSDFIRMEKETPYLHLHNSLPVEELARELPQFDFGIVSGGCAAFGQKLEFLTERYMRSCFSGRIADYLDANLPVLINPEVSFNFKLLRHYGVGVDLHALLSPDFRGKLLAIKQDPQSAARVAAARATLDLQRQAARLGAFYEHVAEDMRASRVSVPRWARSLSQIPRVGWQTRNLIEVATQARHLKDHLTSLSDRLSSEVRGFQTQLASLNQQITSANDQAHARLQEKIRADNAQLYDLDEQVSQLSGLLLTEVEEQTQNIASLEERILAANKEIETLLRREKYRDALESPDAADKIAAFTATMDTLESRNAGLARENEELQTQVRALRQELRLGSTQIDEVAGLLNWPEISDQNARTQGFNELIRITRLFMRQASGRDGSAKGLSEAWQILGRKHFDQLVTEGYKHFKRTIALNYFTFPVQAGDQQITRLEELVGSKRARKLFSIAQSLPDDAEFSLQPQVHFRYLIALLWDYATSTFGDRFGTLEEPLEGDPITLTLGGRRVSQDLVNSCIEYATIANTRQIRPGQRVLEIGGGYGRNAYVFAQLHPDVKVVLVDIPPAIYIAQRYLASVFPDRSIFRVQDFTRYEDVESDLEAASLVFLLPDQLALLPDDFFALAINISSFGEMTEQQIDTYFRQIDRTTRGCFYNKQWQTSQNPFDSLVLRRDGYPVRAHWKELLARPCQTNPEFFEALYDTGNGRG